MNIANINGYTLWNLGRINILLGKNGSGKSILLRQLEVGMFSKGKAYGKIKYIPPERGGALAFDSTVEHQITNSPNWLAAQRRLNQRASFRQESVSQYRTLETLVLREIEGARRQDSDYTFDLYVTAINALLDNIRVQRQGATFKIHVKQENAEVEAGHISSGESELISLCIECLVFSKECVPHMQNLLLLDEPDVHIHPDLQVRLMSFLRDLVAEGDFTIVVATHSTTILGALESFDGTRLGFLTHNQKEVHFKPISGIYRKVLPIFGAHPLSNIFNQAPILLLEGEDDERIWQQAVRSSGGSISVYPCSVEGIDNMSAFEEKAAEIIRTVYDNAKGYSLRDRDDGSVEIGDLLPIVRMKLSCRTAENLLLTDEVLDALKVTWGELKERIELWLQRNLEHPHFSFLEALRDGGFDRKNHDIKEIRNDLMGVIGSAKPWEVAVGQAIAKLRWTEDTDFDKEGSLLGYLGKKVAKTLLPRE